MQAPIDAQIAMNLHAPPKGTDMNKRHFLCIALTTSAIAIAGCASEPQVDPAWKRRSIDADVQLSLSKLNDKSPGTKELVQRARAVLVFPSVWNAGLLVGASHGDGALLIGSRTVGYYSTTSASLGLTAGAQSKSMFILFMTDNALQRFQASEGWTAGVDAAVNVLSVGASGALDTETVRSPVIGFVLSNEGLMADLSVQGAKVTRLKL
jgi:lipid-binding SYLF domain-containing protein